MNRAIVAFFTFHFLLIQLSLLVAAQNNLNLSNELQIRLQNSSKDTAQVHAYHDACKKVIFSNQILAIDYAQRAEELSIELNYLEGEAYSQYIIAYAYTLVSDYKTALEYYLKALRNFTETGDKTYITKTCNELGIIYKDLGDYEEAISFYKKALKITEAVGDLDFSINLLINLGVANMKLSDYKASASYLFKALQISEEQENFKKVALIHGNLGNLYMEQEVYTVAENHYSIALADFKNTGNKRMEAVALNNLGKIFTKLDETDRAIKYYDEAISLFNELQDKMSIADCLKNLGLLYMGKEEQKTALNHYKTALRLYTQLENEVHLAELYALIGGAYLQDGDFYNANNFLDRAITNESRITNNLDKLALYENKYKYHEAMAGFKEALFYYKKYDSLREELLNNQKLQEINDIENSYRSEKQERENQLLKMEQEQQQEVIGRKEILNKFLLVGIVFFLITVVHFFRLYKAKQKTNNLLEERNTKIERQKAEIVRINSDLETSQDHLRDANEHLHELNQKLNSILKKKTSQLNQTSEELDTFFYQSSHALRRPLVHFKGLLEILKLEKEEIKLVDIYDKLDYTFNRMDVMLSKLVMASEVNLERIRDQKIEFKKIVNSIWVFLGLKYDTSHMELNITVQEDLVYQSNAKLIEILFQNLLENAINFKALPELRKAKINISVIEENAYLKIIFKDNGIGIPQDQLPKIFGMFTVSSHLSEGFGLGLYIVKKVVSKLGGNVQVKSEENEYTSFTIILPKQKALYLEELKLIDRAE